MSSALQISRELKSGQRKVLSLIEESIQKAKSYNRSINAIVEDNYSHALEKAELMDLHFQQMSKAEKDSLPLFWGIPYTCKEMIAISGMKSTLGSKHRKDQIMGETASAVERIEKSGAILLGTTNVPEVGFWFECDNVVYGPTKNPFDLSRTSGGSSGGEAAIISTGASYFGIGSDIGGSIRTPAAFCGIFGHKPSEHLIPLTGHYPFYRNNSMGFREEELPFTVLGPMARSSEDLRELFYLMAGPDQVDPRVFNSTLKNHQNTKLSDIKYYFIDSPKVHAASECDPEISMHIKMCGDYISNLGGQTQALQADLFKHAFEMWLARTQQISTDGFVAHLTNSEGISFTKEFLKIGFGRRDYTFPALLTAFLDTHAKESQPQAFYLQKLADLKLFLSKILGGNAVLIMPTHPRLAPKLGSTIQRPFDFSLAAVINALGFPATAVPVGKSKCGLPIGIQVISNEWNDDLCFRVANILEMGFGGAISPD